MMETFKAYAFIRFTKKYLRTRKARSAERDFCKLKKAVYKLGLQSVYAKRF